MTNDESSTKLVCAYTARKLQEIEIKSGSGEGKAMLANLRRGIGKNIGECPELWGIIFENLPDKLMGFKEMSDAEWAIYTALTLYALHRQGNDNSINQEGVSLGTAAAGLVHSDDDRNRIMKRLNLVITANSKEDTAYHLRGLIYLLKNDGVALDYVRLAKDLYISCNPEWANSVKLGWGRDFYKIKNKEKGEDNND